MRSIVVLATILIGGIVLLGAGAPSADAFPKRLIDAKSGTQGVTEIGWRRRYWRRYGVWPTGPRADLDTPPIVTTDDGLVVAPLRPRSCGEYHYWNGFACVDARYNDPYLGPK